MCLGLRGKIEGESRLWRTVVFNPRCSLESLGDFSVNINNPTGKPMKSTFWGSDLQHEYFSKAHHVVSTAIQGGDSLVGPCK